MPLILTIDDSPSLETYDLLDFLKSHQINAVFFCVGKNILKEKDVIKEIISKGNLVANHSFSHEKFSKKNVNIRYEIEETHKIISELYNELGMQFSKRFFRFPYQDKGIGWNPIKIVFRHYSYRFILAQSTLKSLGYINFPKEFTQTDNLLLKIFMNDIDVFTNLNFKDWKPKNLSAILSKIERLNLSKNYILQLHDKKGLLENTKKIIEKLIEKNAQFVLP
jgi:peptidoglycan/xylan/chitin deacetylase (PgdA/CDA1 family)